MMFTTLSLSLLLAWYPPGIDMQDRIQVCRDQNLPIGAKFLAQCYPRIYLARE